MFDSWPSLITCWYFCFISNKKSVQIRLVTVCPFCIKLYRLINRFVFYLFFLFFYLFIQKCHKLGTWSVCSELFFISGAPVCVMRVLLQGFVTAQQKADSAWNITPNAFYSQKEEKILMERPLQCVSQNVK